jgi:hypothetical protein
MNGSPLPTGVSFRLYIVCDNTSEVPSAILGTIGGQKSDLKKRSHLKRSKRTLNDLSVLIIASDGMDTMHMIRTRPRRCQMLDLAAAIMS